MGIFSRIKDAIFGDDKRAPPRAPQGGGAPPKSGNNPGNVVNAKWESPTANTSVDVEQVLTARAALNPQKLNWQTSIVDLMKLLGIDSSLENRKELARELGYTGDTADSASMNIWLHKRVMQELQKNGGKVPASLVA
jgi:hypothetical protein